MKKTMLLCLFISAAIPSLAQEWKSNLDDGIKEASVSGKNVLLFFSNSIDCERCTKLDKNVLQSAEFKEYVKANFVLVKQDFGRATAADLEDNLLIVEKYNKDGFFPLVVILNKNAKVIGQVGAYNNETPQEYMSLLKKNIKS